VILKNRNQARCVNKDKLNSLNNLLKSFNEFELNNTKQKNILIETHNNNLDCLKCINSYNTNNSLKIETVVSKERLIMSTTLLGLLNTKVGNLSKVMNGIVW
jgi:hypothetical protein